MKAISLTEADRLVDTNDRYQWEIYAKVLTYFTPGRGRGPMFRTNGYFNRRWSNGRGRWGTLKRYEINDEGLFIL